MLYISQSNCLCFKHNMFLLHTVYRTIAISVPLILNPFKRFFKSSCNKYHMTADQF